MANEIQRYAVGSISSPTSAVAGTYTITFDSQTTVDIAFDATDATIESALEALSSVGAGNVSVSSSMGVTSLTFQNALGDTNVPQHSTTPALKKAASTISVNTTTAGVAPQNEIQLINFGGATTGSFYITGPYGSGEVTAFDSYGLESALNMAIGSGNYNLTYGGSSWNVEFTGSYAAQDMATMSIGTNTTDGNPYVQDFVTGSVGSPQVVRLTLPDNPTEGSVLLTLDFNFVTIDATDSNPTPPTDWSLTSGAACDWTFTRQTNSTNVYISASESTFLRNDITIQSDTLTEGFTPPPPTPSNTISFGSGNGFGNLSHGNGFN